MGDGSPSNEIGDGSFSSVHSCSIAVPTIDKRIIAQKKAKRMSDHICDNDNVRKTRLFIALQPDTARDMENYCFSKSEMSS
jgi:hypothetical protein